MVQAISGVYAISAFLCNIMSEWELLLRQTFLNVFVLFCFFKNFSKKVVWNVIKVTFLV